VRGLSKTRHREVQERDLPSVGNSGTTTEFGFACSVVIFVTYCYTDVRRLTTGIRSEKCVVVRFRRCANVIECTYKNLDSIALQRMPDTRTVKEIFNWKLLIKRSQGRPKYRWEDNIKQDICQMKIKNRVACVQDRGKWKEVVEKAKTFN